MRCTKPTAFLIFALSILAMPVRAEVSDQEAMESQAAGTLASVDFVRKKCRTSVQIDEQALQSLLGRIGKSADALRRHEDYLDQRDVIADLEKDKSAAMICLLLPMAHGGYGRGIINGK